MTHYPTLSHYQTMKPTLRMPRHINRWAFILTTLASMLELHEARTTRNLISDSASHAHGLWHGVSVFAITLALGVIIASIAHCALKAVQTTAATSRPSGRIKHAA